MDNKEILLNNLDKIEISVFDTTAYQAINNYLEKSEYKEVRSPNFLHNNTKIVNLRIDTARKLTEEFTNRVKSMKQIDDAEFYIHSFITLEGNRIAERYVERADWRDMIENFKKNNNFVFNGYTLKDLQDELKYLFNSSIDEHQIYELIIKEMQDDYRFSLGTDHDGYDDYILSTFTSKAIEIKNNVMSVIENLIKDSSIVDQIEKDEEDNPLTDNFVARQLSSNGEIYKFIINSIKNLDLDALCNELLNGYAQTLTNFEGDKKISISEAVSIINQQFPGKKILGLDTYILSDMYTEF